MCTSARMCSVVMVPPCNRNSRNRERRDGQCVKKDLFLEARTRRKRSTAGDLHLRVRSMEIQTAPTSTAEWRRSLQRRGRQGSDSRALTRQRSGTTTLLWLTARSMKLTVNLHSHFDASAEFLWQIERAEGVPMGQVRTRHQRRPTAPTCL